MSKMTRLFAGAVFAAVLLLGAGAPPAQAASSLTQSQISAILGLLQAFGADAAVIANVNSALGGTPTTSTTAPTITQVRWASGSSVASSTISIKGTNLKGATKVVFYAPVGVVQNASVHSSDGTVAIIYSSDPGNSFIGNLTGNDYQFYVVTPSGTSNVLRLTGLPTTASKLSVAKYGGLSDQTIPPGTENVVIGSFNLTAGSAAGVEIDTINLSLSHATWVGNLRLYDGPNIVAGIISSPSTSNSFNLNLVIPAGTTKTIQIRGDISAGDTSSSGIAIQATITQVTGSVPAISTSLPLQTITIGSTNTPAIAISSPSGGTYSVGEHLNLQWNASGLSTVSANLIPVPANGNQYGIFSNINAGNNSYTWFIPSGIPTGTYQVSIGYGSTNVFSNIFVITAPAITVLSPNNGENWQQGQSYLISWNSVNASSNLIDLVLTPIGSTQGQTIVNDLTNTGSYKWTIPTALVPGLYKISALVGSPYAGATIASDYSDNYFTITAPTTSPAPSASFSASPATVISGSSSTLKWSSTNATSCVISGPPPASLPSWSMYGNTSGSGSTGPLTSTITYNLKCTGPGTATTVSSVSTATASVTITVIPNQTASALSAVEGLNTAQSQGNFQYVWNTNLQIGSSNAADVTALQTALTNEGVYAGDITGGFYNQTFTAVKAFQQKYGIDATGFVGPATREKLNSLY